MRLAVRRDPGGAMGWRGFASALYLVSRTGRVLLLATLVAGLFGLVSIYRDGLRDPRYLDGWVLAGGMGLQLGFHAALKATGLSPKSIMRLRRFHVAIGYLLVAVFLSHSNFSLPDTGFELALWAGFVVVTLSGAFGTYLGWALRSNGESDVHVSYDRIPTRLAELARDVQQIIAAPDPNSAAMALPAPSYDAWIADLHANHLQGFFARRGNFFAHLIGSRRPLQRLREEISNLSRYVDAQGQKKLAAISELATEKDGLDRALVHSRLARGWLFVHVPVTYALVVLSVLHVLIVYSFSSGAS